MDWLPKLWINEGKKEERKEGKKEGKEGTKDQTLWYQNTLLYRNI